MARPSRTFHVSALDASITVRAPSKAKVKTLATMLQDVLARHPERLKGTGKKPVKRAAAKKPRKKTAVGTATKAARKVMAMLPTALRRRVREAIRNGLSVTIKANDAENIWLQVRNSKGQKGFMPGRLPNPWTASYGVNDVEVYRGTVMARNALTVGHF